MEYPLTSELAHVFHGGSRETSIQETMVSPGNIGFLSFFPLNPWFLKSGLFDWPALARAEVRAQAHGDRCRGVFRGP